MRAKARANFNGCLELFIEEAIDELGVFWWDVTGLTALSSQMVELDYARLCLIAAKHDVTVEETDEDPEWKVVADEADRLRTLAEEN